MNAYFVDAGDQQYVADIIGGYPRYETEFACEIIRAESLGRAKALFLRCVVLIYDVEYIEIKAFIIAKGVEGEEGPVDHRDSLWYAEKIDEIMEKRRDVTR